MRYTGFMGRLCWQLAVVVALAGAACGDDSNGQADAAGASDAAAVTDATVDGPVAAPCGTPMAGRSFRLGIAFALHPDRLADSDALTAFVDSIGSYGELFGAQSGWDVNPDSDGVPIAITLAFGWTDGTPTVVYAAIGAEPEAVPPGDVDTYWQTHAAAFQQAALDVVDTYHPRYLSLGIESNRWYVKSAAAFAELVNVHRATYDAIKADDPTVQVGAGIQLDYMRADAELSGVSLTPHFDVLSMFAGKVDFLAVSAYPWLGMDTPADIPATYLTDLTDRLDVPLLISETGWPSAGPYVAGASEQAQLDYVCRLIEVADGVELTGLIYGLPYDGDFSAIFGTPVFDTLGMNNADDTPKPLRSLWNELRAVPLSLNSE